LEFCKRGNLPVRWTGNSRHLGRHQPERISHRAGVETVAARPLCIKTAWSIVLGVKGTMLDFRMIKDADLYGMCVAGEEDAWKYLYNYILRICEGWRISRPEDVAGQVTLELIEGRLGTVRKKDQFRQFVKMLTKSRLKDELKSARAREVPLCRPSEEDDGEEIDPRVGCHEPEQEERLNSLEVAAIVDAAVEKLSLLCRQVIREYLRFKIGLYEDYEELSRVLGMSVPNISSRVTRCMKVLVGFKEIRSLHGLIVPD
jgi:RNA polymerase sigma factor (sigma-70 family)